MRSISDIFIKFDQNYKKWSAFLESKFEQIARNGAHFWSENHQILMILKKKCASFP
jgi:hypothetical protein